AHRRASLCPRAGIAAGEQSPSASTHDRAESRARSRELPSVWLRAVACVDPVERAVDSLLSLPRIGWVAASRWSSLHESARSAGLAGRDRLDRSDALARRSDRDSART